MKRNLPLVHSRGSSHILVKLGFTLIEVLVAMSLMMIILGVGAVAYRNVARKQALETAAAEVAQTLVQAQANALSGKKINCAAQTLAGWQVRFSAGSYTLEEVCQNTNYLAKTIIYPTQIRGTTFPSPNPILFRGLSRGTNISASTTITLTSSQGQTRSITVFSSGEIR